jgi:hypothetical protein
MTTWIFQANPDQFRLDGYLKPAAEIRWTVRQEHLRTQMSPGDRCYIWRAKGRGEEPAGIVASGALTSAPQVEAEDPDAIKFWSTPPSGTALRVRLRLDRVASKKELIQREWLMQDPVLKDLRILRLAAETNYRVDPAHEARLADMWRNTGRAWDERESLAGLWAYAHTKGKEVSRKPGSPVADVAVRIGRAVTGVYNKVMNFRALDPTDTREGLSGGGETDRAVWARYFDAQTARLDLDRLDADYASGWAGQTSQQASESSVLAGSQRLSSGRGQGYESDSDVRKAVELLAMSRAIEHYKALGFEVEDTSSASPFDLRCTKGGLEVRVEVKGTQGEGSTVEVTSGEVENARATQWRTDLFIVSGVQVQRVPTLEASGGQCRLIEAWLPQDADLSPTRYRCRVPDGGRVV